MDFYFQAVSASCLRMTPYRRTPCGLQPTAPHVRARKGIPGSCLAGASHCDPSPFSSTARPGHGPVWRTPGPTSRPPEPVLRARSRRPARCGTPLGTSVRASFRLLQQLRKQLGEKPRPSRETPPLLLNPAPLTNPAPLASRPRLGGALADTSGACVRERVVCGMRVISLRVTPPAARWRRQGHRGGEGTGPRR